MTDSGAERAARIAEKVLDIAYDSLLTHAQKKRNIESAIIQEETGMHAQFAKFTGRILESQRNEAGDVDGAFIEECLIECGLYNPTKVTKPCGENCQCEEFGFPTTCNKLTDAAREALRTCWALPPVPEEGGKR